MRLAFGILVLSSGCCPALAGGASAVANAKQSEPLVSERGPDTYSDRFFRPAARPLDVPAMPGQSGEGSIADRAVKFGEPIRLKYSNGEEATGVLDAISSEHVQLRVGGRVEVYPLAGIADVAQF